MCGTVIHCCASPTTCTFYYIQAARSTEPNVKICLLFLFSWKTWIFQWLWKIVVGNVTTENKKNWGKLFAPQKLHWPWLVASAIVKINFCIQKRKKKKEKNDLCFPSGYVWEFLLKSNPRTIIVNDKVLREETTYLPKHVLLTNLDNKNLPMA